MNLEDFLKLGLEDYGKDDDVLEIYWRRPKIDSPHLVLRDRPEIPLDSNGGERGFLLCYYLRLIREVPKEYRERNVEPPFIEVCPTRERNGCPNNVVQIPLSYITRQPTRLGKKA